MVNRLAFVSLPALVLVAGSARAQTCFQPPQPLAVGSVPEDIVRADFNGDGREDLATANSTGLGFQGSVSVLLGLGAGAFAPPVNYPVGLGPWRLAVGDLDGDGHPDLAVASEFGYYGSTLLNLGDGTFAPAVDHPAIWSARAVVCADFNADAFVDVAFACSAGPQGRVTILFNLGTGAFGAPQNFPVNGIQTALEVADLDGDSHPDLVAASETGGTLSVLLNTGPGQFLTQVEHPGGVEPRRVRAADLDGDGDIDVALASSGGSFSLAGSLWIYLNDGSGSFAPQGPMATHWYTEGLATGDLDGDGAVDLVLGHLVSGTNLRLYKNQGNATFVELAGLAAGNAPQALATADVDADGDLDIAATQYLPDSVAVLRNCTTQWASFCPGDGSLAACPCANSGSTGRGCDNSGATGGAWLSAAGGASIANDTLVLTAGGELDFVPTIVLQGSATIAPAAFGDGLRCVGGSLKRLYLYDAFGGYVSAPLPGAPSISTRSATLGDQIPIGATRYYQFYYRDPNLGFCPGPQGNSWNVTSAVSVTWQS